MSWVVCTVGCRASAVECVLRRRLGKPLTPLSEQEKTLIREGVTEELAHATNEDRLAKELLTKTRYRAPEDCPRLGALNPAEVLFDYHGVKLAKTKVKRAHFLWPSYPRFCLFT